MSGVPPPTSRRDVVPALLVAVAAALGRGDAPNGLILTSPTGGGKSYVLGDFVARLSLPARVAVARQADTARPFVVAAELLEVDLARPGVTADLFRARADELIESQSLVLVVDDVQFADAESVLLLQEFITLDAPIVLVAGRRPLPARPALERLLGLPQVLEWAMPPLDRLDIDVFVHDRTDRWPGDTLRTHLQSAASNALHLSTVLDGLIDCGRAVTAGDCLDLAPGHRDAAPPFVATLDQRVAALSARELDLARVLAVLARPAEVSELAALLEVDPATTLDPTRQLLEAGLVTSRGERLEFAHDAFRAAIYAAVPKPLRRTIHRAAAQRSTDATDRARHVIASEPESGELVEAVRFAVDDLADAPGVTADLLADAVHEMRDMDVAAGLAATRARALARSGQTRLASEVVSEALGWVSDPMIVAELRRVGIFSLSTRGEVDEAIALIDRTLADQLPDRARRLLTEHRWFLGLLAGSAPVPATPFADDPRQLTLNGLIAELLRRYLRGDTGRALEYAWAASRRSLADDFDPNEGQSADIWPPIVALAHSGVNSAREALHEVIALREERGGSWQTAGHQAIGGDIDLNGGQIDDAIAQFDTALDLGARLELGSLTHAAAGAVLVEVLRGDAPAARRRLDTWRGRGEFGLPALDRARVAVLELERRYPAAAELAAEVWTRAGRANLFHWQAVTAAEFARVGMRASDERLIAIIRDGLERLPAPAGHPGRIAADLASLLTGGDYSLVAQRGPQLADEAQALGNGLLAMMTLEESAVAAAVTADNEADRDQARGLARRSIALAEAGGARGVSARVAGRMRAAGVRLGAKTSRGRPSFGWDSLTPTEQHVVELVASGTSGPVIARQLHLSPRTVQTHVSHVLSKLGVSNRVELAAVAIERRTAVAGA
jgi:DNA-binding CsgD family transcriptional regulator